MGLFSKRFEDTVFLKETSDLQDQYNALVKLNEEYPNNEDILEELVIVKKGLKGENEIAYQLKKSNIGMYVLRDVKFQYEDLTAQIDYIIITPVYRYFVECKNLVGDITVNEKGDFIRE
ncbi:MAG: NERD domain-containing protein, partial [Bacilli bacterium]|nr:NERD domain-containing protein [Bacilli bacterium]